MSWQLLSHDRQRRPFANGQILSSRSSIWVEERRETGIVDIETGGREERSVVGWTSGGLVST